MIGKTNPTDIWAASPQLTILVLFVFLNTTCSFFPCTLFSPEQIHHPQNFVPLSGFVFFFSISTIKKSHTISIITNLKITLKLLQSELLIHFRIHLKLFPHWWLTSKKAWDNVLTYRSLTHSITPSTWGIYSVNLPWVVSEWMHKKLFWFLY